MWHLAPRTDLFVEIDPQQKERIFRALQRTGHSVGYLGDGINDAPALHAADVGISVEEAVDVARESADIILLSRDLDVLRTGIEDGRRTFANTLKYISITTSANLGNMVSMALATPLLPFLPLAAKQILLNNFLSDVPSIAISSDNVDPNRVARPQRWNIKDIQRFMVVFGLISSVFDLVTFAVLLMVFHADQATFQTSWFIVSLLTELAVVLVLRTHRPALRRTPSRLLLWTTLVVAVATLAIPVPRAPERGVWLCASFDAPDRRRHCDRHFKSLRENKFLSCPRLSETESEEPKSSGNLRGIRKRQRHFFGKFGRAGTRKSLGRHLGVNRNAAAQQPAQTRLIAAETRAASAVRPSRWEVSGLSASGASR